MPSTPSPTAVAHPRHGAHVRGDGQTRFGLWAPLAQQVALDLDDRTTALQPAGEGWWQTTTDAPHGTRYAYRLDDGAPLPDPASRWLPDGVHDAAAVLDVSQLHRGARTFQAPPLTGAVIYELHIGAFTPEGTFDAAVEHLPALVELGVTHVEVMPVNAFDGHHGWGYDGVAWWAVHQPYGGPERFASFVTACHEAGLAVVLDVVHNHLGPSGNHLSRFGPYLQPDAESTWGKAINLDGPGSGPVRALILDNAVAWLRDFRVDALRLDAVHALVDHSPVHLLAEMADRVGDLAEAQGRRLTLIAESDRNDPRTVTPRALGGLGLDGQWADDLHHAIHCAVTGEDDGYYVDFTDPLEKVAAAYRNGFVYDGSLVSPFRGRVVGAPLPPQVSSRRLVACIQNHDQVGNRAAGDRLTRLVPPDLVRVAVALLCLAPHTPMLFMGEEYGETTPFQFFSDMPGEDLRQAIRQGRRREFEAFSSWQAEVPDPLDHATFQRSTLDRSAADTDAGQQRRALWRDLLALRRAQPALATGRRDLLDAHVLGEGGDLMFIYRRPSTNHPDAPLIAITANLSDSDITVLAETLLLSTADPRYGGTGPLDAGTVAARSVAVHAVPHDPADLPGAEPSS